MVAAVDFLWGTESMRPTSICTWTDWELRAETDVERRVLQGSQSRKCARERARGEREVDYRAVACRAKVVCT